MLLLILSPTRTTTIILQSITSLTYRKNRGTLPGKDFALRTNVERKK